MAINLSYRTQLGLGINPIAHTFIRFLPLSRAEFIDKIKDEIDLNPMLEIVPPQLAIDSDRPQINEIEKKLERADTSFLTPYEDMGFFKPSSDKLDRNSVIDIFASSKISLPEHLLKQASTEFNQDELLIAEQIVYNLNKDGFLELSIESIASALNSTPEKIEYIRKKITSFDPVGNGSKTLKECLLSQIGEENEENKELISIIENHLEDLAKHRFDRISSSLNIDSKKIIHLIEKIKRLNPRPSSTFDTEEVDYAEVDLILVKINGEYKVRYVAEGIPKLLLSSYYDEMLEKKIDKTTDSFLKDRQRNAILFIEGIDLRKTIIESIATYLVKVQKDFLDLGEKWKRPLTMKDVAQELGYNESTISRAVNNKFIASEKGLIPLKIFFAHGLKGEFGFSHSAETIKDKIKNLINAEDKNKPLSDQDLSHKLSELGIKIARRTISNYREELNILSSSKRKQEYKLKGG